MAYAFLLEEIYNESYYLYERNGVLNNPFTMKCTGKNRVLNAGREAINGTNKVLSFVLCCIA
jgi:hypothetical protein